MERALNILAFLLQMTYCQKEEEKFIVYKALPRKLQVLFVRRKMDVLDSKVVFRKLVCDPETCREIIPLQRTDRKGLLDCGSDRLISQTFRLGVDRPHAG